MSRFALPALGEDENLVAELHRLDVRHLARFSANLVYAPISPANLIAALATHLDARLQAALILLFLRRPDYQRYLSSALDQLNLPDQLTLKLYYQAAVYLQRELMADLAPQAQRQQILTDCFSGELSLPAADTIRPGRLAAQAALDALGARHQQHSGWQFNWAGSYRQNIPLFLKHLGTRDP